MAHASSQSRRSNRWCIRRVPVGRHDCLDGRMMRAIDASHPSVPYCGLANVGERGSTCGRSGAGTRARSDARGRTRAHAFGRVRARSGAQYMRGARKRKPCTPSRTIIPSGASLPPLPSRTKALFPFPVIPRAARHLPYSCRPERNRVYPPSRPEWSRTALAPQARGARTSSPSASLPCANAHRSVF